MHPAWTRRRRLGLERLETRLTPAVRLTYAGVGGALAITENGVAADNVSITESGGVLQVSLNNGAVFDAASTTAGVTYFGNGTPSGTSFAQIDTSAAGAINGLTVNLGGGTDVLRVTLENASGGVSSVAVNKTGTQTTYLNSIDLYGGALSVVGGQTLLAGAVVNTRGGNVVLSGTGTTALTSGVQISSSTLDAGGGNINIAGTSAVGTSTSTGTYGVYVGTSNLLTTGAGAIAINGVGAAGNRYHQGVMLTGSAATRTVVRTQNGNVTLTGTSRALGNVNYAVNVTGRALVESTGTGGVFLNGTGAPGAVGSFNNSAVVVNGVGTIVRSANGVLSLRGVGNGRGTENHGLYIVNGAVVETTGTGKLYLWGQGGNGTAYNFGVLVFKNGAHVRTANADIDIKGYARGRGVDNYGVNMERDMAAPAEPGVSVTAGGVGKLTIRGVAGNGTNLNAGAVFNTNTTLRASGGDINVTGFGSGFGQKNWGVAVLAGSQIIGTGNARVLLTGTSGNGTSFNHGVMVDQSLPGRGTAFVRTVNRDIIIRGGGSGSTPYNYGVSIGTGGTVYAGGTGRIFLTSTARDIAFGVGGRAQSGTGNIVLQSAGGITIPYGAALYTTGAGVISMKVDVGNPAPGVGTTSNIAGAALVAAGIKAVTGGPDADTLFVNWKGFASAVAGGGVVTFAGGRKLYYGGFETFALVVV